MQWHDFVFSNRLWPRLLRHIVFWGVWCLYFFGIYWYNQHITGYSSQAFTTLGSHIFLKSFLLVFLHAITCYAFIYFLLPRYLTTSKWLKLITGTLLLSISLFVAGYFLYKWVFPFVNFILGSPADNTNLPLLWSSASIGLLNAPKVVAAATAIKLVKNWWLKQKEKEGLERERISTELELLKAQIRPGFLFHALNNIYAYSLAASPRASEMLLKLSDLLSYMLYECDKPLVPVEKEIEMMNDYMDMEKIRQNENIEMDLSVKGELSGKRIAPFLLLPFIENSFKQIGQMTEGPWINMEIKMEENIFSMKLINGMKPEISGRPELHENVLANVEKRLTLLYPERHELKITVAQEMLIVLLKIQLDETQFPLAKNVIYETHDKGIAEEEIKSYAQ